VKPGRDAVTLASATSKNHDMPRSSIAFLAALVLITAVSAHAEEPPRDQVSFTVEAESESQNDLAEALLAVETESAKPATVAEDVNRAMSWALDQARGTEGVSFQTADYQTYPIYDDKGRLLRWHGSQTLILRSGKIAALSELAGQLQQRLQIKSLRFMPSPERRRDAEAQLTDQVLAQFKERAGRIQRDLDAKGYRIITLDLQQGGASPLAFSRMAVAESAAAPVATEAGVSRLQLTGRAVIQLQY
jgi:predicted secreted protein